MEEMDPYKGTYRIQSQEVTEHRKATTFKDIGMPQIVEVETEKDFLLLLKDIKAYNENQADRARSEGKSRYIRKTIR